MDVPGVVGKCSRHVWKGGRLFALGLTFAAGLSAAVATLLLLLGTIWTWPITVVILGGSIRCSEGAVSVWTSTPVASWNWTSWRAAFAISLGLGILGAVVPLRATGVVQQAPWAIPFLCGVNFLMVLAAIFGFSRYVLSARVGERSLTD